MEQGETSKNVILDDVIEDLPQEVLLSAETGQDLEDVTMVEVTEIDLEDEATEIDLNLMVRTDFEGDQVLEEAGMIVIDSDSLETSLNVLDVTARTVKE